MKKNRVKNNAPAIVISAGDSPAAFDIVRSLGKEGVCTFVASSQVDDLAYYSKYCAGKIPLYPFDRDNESRNLELLMEFAEHREITPVLYYTSDPELSFLVRNREVLSQRFRFLLPTDLVLECLFNKVLFSLFAMSYQLPVPSTTVIKDFEDLSLLISSIKFPCIVKPAFSEDWNWDTEEQQERFGPYKKALRRIRTREDLLFFCSALPKRQSGFLIQSYIDGRDENIFSFHGYFDEHSECLGHFIGSKIRTYPPHTGGSAYIQTIKHPSLAQLSIDLLKRIQFQGIVKIDYKWDPVAEEFKILELNPRYNLWEVLGVYAGVNLAYLAYCHQTGNVQPSSTTFRDNVRLLYLKQDIRAFVTGYRGIGEWSTLQYFRSLLHKNHYRIFDPQDVIPFFSSSYSFIVRNVMRSYSAMRNKIKELYEVRGQKTLISVGTVSVHENGPR